MELLAFLRGCRLCLSFLFTELQGSPCPCEGGEDLPQAAQVTTWSSTSPQSTGHALRSIAS